MKVCYFGIYNPKYSRNKVLIKGLEENGVEIIECQVDPKKKFKYWKLFKKHRKVGNYDFMIVGFPGHTVMPLAKLICRKPIIFDALVSLYDSNVFDRKNVSPHSLKALKYWLLDWFSCKLANVILLDTNEHINYFVKKYGINKEKFHCLYIGSDNEIMYPRPSNKNHSQFLVHFHGTYIPLQGIEYIIEAAKLLEAQNIKFNLIGRGQTQQEIINLSKKLNTRNVNFIDFLPQEELVKYIAQADVCLGIFGQTPKAKRVIPNKVYEAIAMKKSLITADTPAVREIFKNREHCLLCNIADSKDLAEKILELKNNPELRNQLAENGYKLYKEKLTPRILGQELKNILEELR